jgi:hypothetical protein
MTISKIDLSDAMKLEFDVKVEGARGDNPKVNFVIEGDNYSLKFAGTRGNGAYMFDIPALRGVLPPGEKKCFLECIIDDHYFTPIHDTVEIIQPIVVESVVKSKEASSDKLSVSAAKESVKYTLTDAKKFRSLAEQFGYKVSKHQDKILAMMGEEVRGAYDTLKNTGVIKGS